MTKLMKIMRLIIMGLCFFAVFSAISLAADKSNATDPALSLIHALGCKGCHVIQGDGGTLATDLSQVGSRLTAAQISSQLTAQADTRTKGFMPSYSSLTKEDLDLISQYLYNLR